MFASDKSSGKRVQKGKNLFQLLKWMMWEIPVISRACLLQISTPSDEENPAATIAVTLFSALSQR